MTGVLAQDAVIAAVRQGLERRGRSAIGPLVLNPRYFQGPSDPAETEVLILCPAADRRLLACIAADVEYIGAPLPGDPFNGRVTPQGWRMLRLAPVPEQQLALFLDALGQLMACDGGAPVVPDHARPWLLQGPVRATVTPEDNKPEPRIPTIARLGRDLNALAREGRLPPVIGRDAETERVLAILSKAPGGKRTPILIGLAGCGKTAIAEGIAQRVVAGRVPPSLRELHLFDVPLSAVAGGASMKGEVEARVRSLVEEARANPDVCLVIDEAHQLCQAHGDLSVAEMLKPALARGEIRCLCMTTFDGYRNSIEPDGALARRLIPVPVAEPTDDDTLAIVKARGDALEQHHGVAIPNEVAVEAIRLANRYLPDRCQPDKTIDLLDETAARMALEAAGSANARKQSSDCGVSETAPAAAEARPPEAAGRTSACPEVNRNAGDTPTEREANPCSRT